MGQLQGYVEFVGASGVGKSFLYHNILNLRVALHPHFMAPHATGLNILLTSFKCSMVSRDIRVSCLRESTVWIKGFPFKGNSKHYAVSRLLNLHNATLGRSDIPRELQESISEFYLSLIKRHSLLLSSGIPSNMRIIADEGLLMNTRGLAAMTRNFFLEIDSVLPEYVIWVQSDLQTVINNLESRQIRLGLKLDDRSRSRIVAGYQRQIAENLLLIETLASIGVKIIEVYNNKNCYSSFDIITLKSQLAHL